MILQHEEKLEQVPNGPTNPKAQPTPRPAEKSRSLGARIFRAYRKASGGSMLLSIAIHVVILLVGAYLVVSQITEERKISFGGGDPGPKSEIQHKVKRRTTTAPAPNKRITTTSNVAKVALPDMPSVPMNMGPSIAGSMGSGGFGPLGSMRTDGGAGGKGGFSKITFFGLRGGKGGGNLLKATFYDLKQSQDKKPTDMDDDGSLASQGAARSKYMQTVREFVGKGQWNPSTLSKFYHSDTPLYSSRIYVPADRSEEAPKAFGVEKEVKGDRWLVHYKGKFRVRKDGEFRFVGCGDNVLVVRINKKNIFDGSGRFGGDVDPTLKTTPEEKLGIACVSSWQLTPSKWFRLSVGQIYEIEVAIGDCGGLFSAFLLFEEKGATYGKRKDGSGSAYPLFQLDGTPLPAIKSPNNLKILNPDVVTISGIFEGTPSGL